MSEPLTEVEALLTEDQRRLSDQKEFKSWTVKTKPSGKDAFRHVLLYDGLEQGNQSGADGLRTLKEQAKYLNRIGYIPPTKPQPKQLSENQSLKKGLEETEDLFADFQFTPKPRKS